MVSVSDVNHQQALKDQSLSVSLRLVPCLHAEMMRFCCLKGPETAWNDLQTMCTFKGQEVNCH